MTKREKFLWGGIGGIITLVLSVLRMNYEVIATVTLGVVIFWTIRTLILFALGGLSTFLHKTEEIPVLIQLGIAAPMLFSGYVTQNTVAQQAELQFINRVSQYIADSRVELIATAAAADTEDSKDVCESCDSTLAEVSDFMKGKVWDFAEKEPTIGDSVKQALTGLVPPSHFLILGERDSYFEARRFALQMMTDLIEKNLIKPESLITIRVFKPYKHLKWSVVCSRRLTHQQADMLVEILNENKFTPKVYDLAIGDYQNEGEKQ